jgi:hypothetical protein
MQLRIESVEEAQRRGMSYLMQVKNEMRQEIADLLFLDNVVGTLSPLLKERLANLKALYIGFEHQFNSVNAALTDLEVFVKNSEIEDEAVRREHGSDS